MKKKPYEFWAKIGEKPFKARFAAVVVAVCDDDQCWRFTKPVDVKDGDVFSASPTKELVLNGQPVSRNLRPPKKIVTQVSWVAKKLRVAVFLEDRDPIWTHGKNAHKTGKFSKPYWCAIDTRSYHVGTGESPMEAIKRLVLQVKATEDMADEARTKEKRRVIRWRCLLEPKEVREMERKAMKTGFILDGFDWRQANWRNLEKWKA